MRHRVAVLVAIGCLGNRPIAPLEAQGPAASPLFRVHDPLVLRLETDLRALLRDRDADRIEYAGVLRYGANADTGSTEVQLRTRGIFRLKRCGFPPLRLDLPRRRLDGTPFAGQDKLKLVTHCQSARSYEWNLLREYAVYRVFNAVTDSSFQVRLARVTYIDTTRTDTIIRYGFLIESETELAQRLGAEIVESNSVHDFLIDARYMTLVAVFQYLVGNTDWSVWGRHNFSILRQAGAPPRLLAVPYDFDFSGAVGAPYATPPEQLPIRSVRERYYRGYCQPDSVLMPVLARFRGAKDSVYAAVRAVPDLPEGDLRDLLRYFDDFFSAIDNPGIVRREFVRGCRSLPR
ncbi:MAG TPA: hypothetical protein VGQ06_10190 [Gemmatimonadales bacterium]|jgi:hypothetical protein|nr:hypothetical protein [Gemmatimonadales bacterium]